MGDHLGTLGAVRFFCYALWFLSHQRSILFIPLWMTSFGQCLVGGTNLMRTLQISASLLLCTLSECLFFFGIYSFHFGGLGKTYVFQFLEAETPSISHEMMKQGRRGILSRGHALPLYATPTPLPPHPTCSHSPPLPSCHPSLPPSLPTPSQ